MPIRRRDNIAHTKGGSFVAISVPDQDIKDAAQKAEEKRAKDDNDRKQKEDDLYNQNQYWKTPEQFDIEELLAEQDEESKEVKVAVENPKPSSVLAETSENSGKD